MSGKDLLRQIFFVYRKTTGDLKKILNIKRKEDTTVNGNRITEEVLETEEDITESEEQIWEDVMSGFFPNAESEEEIEEELDNMFND